MEIWKEVVGFEQEYEISNLGILRSKERFVNHWRGTKRKYKSKIKNQRLNSHGYMRCNLKSNAKRFDFTIHQLVAKAFLKNDNNYKFVNHINGIKTDNRVENLEWCTSSENSIHSVKLRLTKTKLSDFEAMEIYNNGLSTRKLSKIYNISSSVICKIKNKKAYKHLWLQ